MALFTPKRLPREVQAIPYKGKPNPKEAKEKAKQEADLKAEKEAKEAKKIEAKTSKNAEVVEQGVSEETQEKEI